MTCLSQVHETNSLYLLEARIQFDTFMKYDSLFLNKILLLFNLCPLTFEDKQTSKRFNLISFRNLISPFAKDCVCFAYFKLKTHNIHWYSWESSWRLRMMLKNLNNSHIIKFSRWAAIVEFDSKCLIRQWIHWFTCRWGCTQVCPLGFTVGPWQNRFEWIEEIV